MPSCQPTTAHAGILATHRQMRCVKLACKLATAKALSRARKLGPTGCRTHLQYQPLETSRLGTRQHDALVSTQRFTHGASRETTTQRCHPCSRCWYQRVAGGPKHVITSMDRSPLLSPMSNVAHVLHNKQSLLLPSLQDKRNIRRQTNPLKKGHALKGMMALEPYSHRDIYFMQHTSLAQVLSACTAQAQTYTHKTKSTQMEGAS